MEDQYLAMIDNRICSRCLLRDMTNADIQMIEKYKNELKQEDQVDEKEYERRLSICKNCVQLNAGTCMSCGCYVELRAAMRPAHCPRKQW